MGRTRSTQIAVESLDARRLFAVAATIGTFSDTTLTEGAVGGSRSFIVGISARQTTETIVNFAWGGTAAHPIYITGGEDFETGGGVEYTFPNDSHDHPFIRIPAGETYRVITIYPAADSLLEPTESLTVSLLSGNYTTGTPNTINYTLLDAPPSAATRARTTDDAMVADGASATKNFGSNTVLQTRRQHSGAGQSAQSYLRFDLTGVNSIASAVLSLSGKLSSALASGVAVSVYKASTSFSEGRITWNSKPATTGGPIGSFTVTGTTSRVYTLNITTFLKAELAAGRHVVTLALINPSVSSPFAVFASDEAISNNRPELQFRQ